MKRAFAILVVVILALGMIGLFFPVLMSAPVVSPPTVTTTTTTP